MRFILRPGTPDNGWQKTGESELAASPPVVEKEEYIFVDPTKTFQTIIGIGGALTDASAETFYKLQEDRQREILRAYFDPQTGIGYTPGRTHIHSCDFSSESYTYVKDGDKQLDSFDISHDLKYRIPFIKAAMTEAGNHFSKFVSPGAKRITSSSTTDKLLTTAFLNKDGKIAVMVLNLSDQMQPFNLWLGGKSMKNKSPPHSIITLVIS